MKSRIDLVKQFLAAFAKAEHSDFIENVLAPDFTFSAPPDPLLDRAGFFEKCLLNGTYLKELAYVRLIEAGNEVIVTHTFRNPNGVTACNTDIFTFEGEQITRLEVFFGWEIGTRLSTVRL